MRCDKMLHPNSELKLEPELEPEPEPEPPSHFLSHACISSAHAICARHASPVKRADFKTMKKVVEIWESRAINPNLDPYP